MKKNAIIALLCEQSILDQLSDGPVSMMLSQNGKPMPLTVTRERDRVIVTTGRFLRRRMRISLAQLEGTGHGFVSQ